MEVITKAGRKPRWTEKTTQQLIDLHKQKKLPQEMASLLGFCDATIRKKHEELGLKPNTQATLLAAPKVKAYKPPATTHPLILAEETFGGRFDKELMRLDNVPIRFLDLMREANKVLKALGRPQWTGDESCVI